MAGDRFITIKTNIDTVQADTKLTGLIADFKRGFDEAGDAAERALGGEVKYEVFTKFNVDTQDFETGLRKSRPILDGILKDEKKIEQARNGSVISLKNSLKTLLQQRDSIRKYKEDIYSSAGGVRTLTKEWLQAQAAVDKAQRLLNEATKPRVLGFEIPKIPGLDAILGVAGKFNAITAAATTVIQLFGQIGQAAQVLIQRATQVSQLQLAFKAFGVSVEDSGRIINDAKAISLTYGASLEAVEKSYKRLTPVILANGGTVADTTETIRALTARMTALGLNADQSNRYIEAFAQVMGKGKLQGEELNQQFAEIDGALRSQIAAYAKANYGITDFEDAMSSGAITAELFRQAILEISKDAVKQLENSFDNLAANIDKLNPAQLENVKNTLNTISLDNLNKTFAETGRLFQAIGVQFSEFFAALTNKFPEVNEFFAFLGQVLGFTLLGALVAIQGVIVLIVGTLDLIIQAIKFVVIGITQIITNIARLFGFKPPAWLQAFLDGKTKITEVGAAFRNWIANAIGGTSGLSDQVKALNEQEKQVVTTKEEQIRVAQQAIDARKQELEQAKILWGIEKANIQEKIEKYKQEKEERVNSIRDAKDAEDAFHNSRMEQLNEQLDALKKQKDEIQDRYSAEIAALEKKTPAEERLVELRKQELAAKAANTSLSEKERLEAQASLDQLIRSEKIGQLKLKQKEEEKVIDQKIKKAQEEKTEEEKRHKDEVQLLNDKLKETERFYDGNIKRLEGLIKERDNEFKKSENILKNEQSRLEAAKQTVNATGDLNKSLAATETRTGNVANAAERIESALRRASQYKIQVPNLGPNEFAGGPVQAGQTYTVNELGQEAFLSAAGKLSMINAPSWGQWKAPSSGTIIPAHLAAQLDIPKGGVNLNAIRGSIGSSSVSTINASRSRSKVTGDRIINNVTIQSNNPSQDAPNIMLNLVRQRRAFRR